MDDFEKAVRKYNDVADRLNDEPDNVAYSVLVSLTAQFLANRFSTERDALRAHKCMSEAVIGIVQSVDQSGLTPWTKGTPH